MQFLDDDIVVLRRADGTTWQYYWGDRIEDLGVVGARREVRVIGAKGPVDHGFIRADAKLRDTGLLRLSMVDVQQGDGLILETPDGKVILIDGGDNQLFARHAAARFSGTSAQDPLVVDAVLVTHGDADHFEGLSEIPKSETNAEPRKRLFMTARRVFHNGLAKRPGKLPTGEDRTDVQMFGATATVAGRPYCTGLVDDPRQLPATELNRLFQTWAKTIEGWAARLTATTGEAIEVRRLDQTATDAFDFLAPENISLEVLGPITETVAGGPALAFLATPGDDTNLLLGVKPSTVNRSWSASHTINGHSIAFRLRYGHVRFLFTGDLNQESMARLRSALPDAGLRAEILKTPHHGSADFDYAFLQEVSPVVSLISSGDESKAKEYIHPRATLMAALGKASRQMPAVIFCTELAAFFSTRGYVTDPATGKTFYAFERTNFGIVHVRTDGERVLAFTHSGKEGMNEAYRFTVSPSGEATFAAKVVKRSAPAAT
jgi:beta-lactamase superfamily II metal-dependent hydrolase